MLFQKIQIPGFVEYFYQGGFGLDFLERRAVFLSLAAIVGGACYEIPGHPVYGYEKDDISCSDYVDNDGDGLIDCYDPDCLILSHLCGEDVPEHPADEPENQHEEGQGQRHDQRTDTQADAEQSQSDES